MSHFEELIESAEELVLVADRLYRTQRIRVEIFGRPLRNRRPLDLLDTLEFAERVDEHCTPDVLLSTLTLVDSGEVGPSLVDIGDLIARNRGEAAEIRGDLEAAGGDDEARPVIINGFGRIGRLLVRQLSQDGGQPFLDLQGIQVRAGSDLARRAALLKYDSIHGTFPGRVEYNPEAKLLVVNDRPIQFYETRQHLQDSEGDDPLQGLSNALMLETTGSERDGAELSELVDNQIGQILLTAPGKNMPNLVYGVSELKGLGDPVVSASSCTTNAAAVLLDLLDEELGVEYAQLETVHSYTNDQNLVDNIHGSARRGRSAPLNIVMTSSGAATAVTEVLPQLEGKLTVNSVRVPVADVSLLIFNLHLSRSISAEQLRDIFRQETLKPRYRDLIGISEEPEAVSSDFIGDRHACVIDLPAIQAIEDRCSIYAWYDNEVGYCAQVLRLAQCLSADVAPMLNAGPVGELLSS